MADASIQANSYYRRIHAWVWMSEPRSGLGRRALHAARYALALARDLAEGEISLRAMSLVYTTLLSLVPLLALAFSVLKALGVHNSLAPVLQRLLEPLGSQAEVVSHDIIGFVDNMQVGVLGFLGVVLLLYTAVSVLSKIESSFNFIWKIGRTRGMTKRFSEYLVVLMVGPLLMFAALGLTASVRNSAVVEHLAEIQPFGALILLLTKAVPYLLMVGSLTFVYGYVPNTRVELHAAAIGGLFAGVVWQSASVAFAAFVSNANYGAIYSGFAIVIVLLVWIYVGWLIVLCGCRLAFYVQNPRFLAGGGEAPAAASRAAEYQALRIAALVAGRFLRGEPGPQPDELPRLLGASAEYVQAAVQLLVGAGALASVQPGDRLLPARDPGSYTLAQLWSWCRGELPEPLPGDAEERRVQDLLHMLESGDAGSRRTLRDWLNSGANAAGQR